MKYFVTSDTHYGHGNIIKYCNRPFRDLAHMNERLIKNFNERVKPEDTCFFLGDFCFKNSAGGNQGEGVPVKSDEYINALNGKKVFVKGNHDGNNSLKTIIENVVINYGGLRIAMIHDPCDFLETTTFNRVELNLCGHVHGSWKHIWRGNSMQCLIVNVGVDVWRFYPQTLDEIIAYAIKTWKAQPDYDTRKKHNVAANIGHHAEDFCD